MVFISVWLKLVVNKYFAVYQILSRILEGRNKFCQSSASGPLFREIWLSELFLCGKKYYFNVYDFRESKFTLFVAKLSGRCFCWFSPHVGAHPDGHQHGVSMQSSINLGDILLRIARELKTAEIWFLVSNMTVHWDTRDVSTLTPKTVCDFGLYRSCNATNSKGIVWYHIIMEQLRKWIDKCYIAPVF